MKPSGVHFRFMLNYYKEMKGNRERTVYPLFEHFNMLQKLREVKKETIFDIDKFELTYFPDLFAIYKLDLRIEKKPGFILLSAKDIPVAIHDVLLGETIQNHIVSFKIMYHYDGPNPLLTGYLEKTHRVSEKVEQKKVFDFPIELLYLTAKNIVTKRKRKKLIDSYHWKADARIIGPFDKPLSEEEEFEVENMRYLHKYVTFSQDIV